MNFDIIIGNPPYQDNTGGGSGGNGAKSIYHEFIKLAWRISPDGIMSFIIPSRWFTGGQGIGDFTCEMINNRHISNIILYNNAKDIFPNNSIAGGIMYYTENRKEEYNTFCYTTITNGVKTEEMREIGKYDIFIKDSVALNILDKLNGDCIDYLVSRVDPYGIATNYRGTDDMEANLKCLTSAGIFDYKSINDIDYSKYKVFLSTITSEHANEPDKDGQYKIFARLGVLEPYTVCSASYITIGEWATLNEANKMVHWLKSKLVRFIVKQFMVGIHINKKSFRYVPIYPDNFDYTWSNKQIYDYFNLNDKEISAIENSIKEL